MTQLSPLGRFDKILVATDGSEFSAGAVRLALLIAQRCQVTPTVMTIVLSNPEYDAIAPQLAGQAETRANEILNEVSDQAAALGISLDRVVCRGQDPYREIIQQEEDMQADLIVMGRRGRRGLARMMVGDATAKVCGHAKCSVLVVPKAADMWTQRILVATDGSRCSDAAAVAAGRLAELCELPISVVSTVRPVHNQARQDQASSALARVMEAYRDQHLDTTGLLEQADRPEEAIVTAAVNEGADLIVVGSHGHTGLQKILLGSVSERVIGLSQVPVLVVKAG